jgi:Ser/Thr protein kinase RdoA (MazF antagonist)
VSANSFFSLNPEFVLQATEKAGFIPTGEFTQLNSYENRVFDLKLEIDEKNNQHMTNVIAKFYRPQRWTADCIREEHTFLTELNLAGIQAVAPLAQANGDTLSNFSGLEVAFFRKIYGRMPDELLKKDYATAGRLIAQIHNVGSQKDFQHRPEFAYTPYTAWDSLNELDQWIAPEMRNRYSEAASEVIESLEDQLQDCPFIRIHGDLHRGNLLSNQGFFIVDFDDAMTGPAMQDLWMLLQNFDDEEKEAIVSGYEELREFPHSQWSLIPCLRGLRIISYSAWIARRWNDPSFPKLFPHFRDYSFWAEETEAIEAIAWTNRTI